MLVYAVQILAGQFANEDKVGDDNLKLLDYKKITDINAVLANGEFELKLDNKVLIPRSSMSLFDTDILTTTSRKVITALPAQ